MIPERIIFVSGGITVLAWGCGSENGWDDWPLNRALKTEPEACCCDPILSVMDVAVAEVPWHEMCQQWPSQDDEILATSSWDC